MSRGLRFGHPAARAPCWFRGCEPAALTALGARMIRTAYYIMIGNVRESQSVSILISLIRARACACAARQLAPPAGSSYRGSQPLPLMDTLGPGSGLGLRLQLSYGDGRERRPT
jgi:hypothetical protein